MHKITAVLLAAIFCSSLISTAIISCHQVHLLLLSRCPPQPLDPNPQLPSSSPSPTPFKTVDTQDYWLLKEFSWNSSYVLHPQPPQQPNGTGGPKKNCAFHLPNTNLPPPACVEKVKQGEQATIKTTQRCSYLKRHKDKDKYSRFKEFTAVDISQESKQKSRVWLS